MALELKHGDATLMFDAYGQLIRLAHAPSGRTVVALPSGRGHSSALVVCRARDDAHGGTTYAMPALRGEPVDHGAGARLRLGSGDGAVELRCEIGPELEHGWIWRVTVRNHGPLPIWAVTLPLLERVGWSTDDGGRLTVPFNSGWTVPVRGLLNQDEMILHYPVHLSMQWVDVHTRDLGLYFAVHDPAPWLKQLVVRREATGLALGWRFVDLHIVPGEERALPPLALALHEGDWRAGAALYRRWIAPYVTPSTPPAWLAELPAWSWITVRGQHAPRLERTFADLPALLRKIRESGVPIGHLAGWMEHGHDTHFPDYWPGETAGGPDALRAAIGAIQRDGGRLALYTNGRLIDPAGSVGAMDHWQEMAVVSAPCAWDNTFQRTGNTPVATPWDPDERLAKEQYTNVVFALGCPGSARWRALLVERLAHAVIDNGADGLYVDQVCGCSAVACYADHHDHAHPALAWSGYLPLLAELRARLRAHNPEVYMSTEGMGDLLGQFFDVQQAHNDWAPRLLTERGLPLPELFRWTFPDMLVAIGPTSPNDERFLRLGHAMAAGYDNFMLLAPRCEERFLAQARRILGWRKRLAAAINGGEPLRAESAHWPDCRVFALRKGEVVTITGAWCPHGDRTPAPVETVVRVNVPEGLVVAAVVLDAGADQAQPAFARDADALEVRVPAHDLFVLHVALEPGA